MEHSNKLVVPRSHDPGGTGKGKFLLDTPHFGDPGWPRLGKSGFYAYNIRRSRDGSPVQSGWALVFLFFWFCVLCFVWGTAGRPRVPGPSRFGSRQNF